MAAAKRIRNRDSAVKVVIVGSIGLDTIKTPHSNAANVLGGSISYACAAASFFARSGMVGVVGYDFPSNYVKMYRDFGLDLTGLKRVEGRTFRWTGEYDKDLISRKTLATELNVFADFAPVLPESYCDAPYVLLANIAPELQLRVLAQMKSPKFVVADTMNMWINQTRAQLLKLIAKVDMLTINDEEARLLAGKTSLKECAAVIAAMGPKYLVIKKGEHGALLFSRSGIFIVPAFPVDRLRDPTGAGDCFAGAFIGAMARGGKISDRNVRQSLLFGSVVASFGVQEFSLGGLSKLTMTAIRERYAALRKMIAV